MLTQEQKQQILSRGISEAEFNTQLNNFVTGFPYLNIVNAATPAKGIKVLDNAQQGKMQEVSDNYKGTVCKNACRK